MKRFLSPEGYPVDATSPRRLIWYANCGYFTDDWFKLKVSHLGAGIPLCPVCSCPGMQVIASKWDKGIVEYTKITPGYAEFVKSSKEHCFKDEGGFRKAFEQWTLLRDDTVEFGNPVG